MASASEIMERLKLLATDTAESELTCLGNMSSSKGCDKSSKDLVTVSADNLSELFECDFFVASSQTTKTSSRESSTALRARFPSGSSRGPSPTVQSAHLASGL